MATNTTNYNLVKPAYADTADIADVNSNMDIIDGQMKTNADGVSANATSLAKAQSGLAYIVGNTNTTGSVLAAGTYVYVKGHSSIAEGLRITTASISNNGSITTSNTSAVSGGGLNSLNSNIMNKSTVDYIDISISNDHAAAISALTNYVISYQKFLGALVIGTNSITAIPYTYSNLVYVALKKIVDMTDAPNGDYTIRAWYKVN